MTKHVLKDSTDKKIYQVSSYEFTFSDRAYVSIFDKD